jgi:hypothetical protein
MLKRQPGFSGPTSVGAIMLRLGIIGPAFTAVGLVLADVLAGEPVNTAVTLVLVVVWGAISYLTIRRLRSATPRWKAAVGAVLSAAWSFLFWLLLLAALLIPLFFFGGSGDFGPGSSLP